MSLFFSWSPVQAFLDAGVVPSASVLKLPLISARAGN